MQLKVLFVGNLIFGTLSILTIALGVFIINNPDYTHTQTSHIFCINNWEWISNDTWGVLFIMLHQMLILLQINLSQYVMVRIPYNMGIFDEDKQHEFEMAFRQKLARDLNKHSTV